MAVVIERKTKETDIQLMLEERTVNGLQAKRYFEEASLGFFDHMLTALTYYAKLNLSLTCRGDAWIDTHHTVEDVGIVFGQAIQKLLEEKVGYMRFGTAYVPMDEALVRTVLDLSKRPYFVLEGIKVELLPESEQSLVEFLRALSQNAGITLHIDVIRGTNRHHIFEAIFKSVGQALGQAMVSQVTQLSTKGRL